MIAEHVNGIERHQGFHGSPRVERAAHHVAEIDDLAYPLRADVGQHGFQREIVSVHIGNRSKAHVGSAFSKVWWHDRKNTVLIWVTPVCNSCFGSSMEPEFRLAGG